MRGKFKREGAYVYPWLIHVDVWQKATLYCKAIILQLQINKFKFKERIRKKKRVGSSTAFSILLLYSLWANY